MEWGSFFKFLFFIYFLRKFSGHSKLIKTTSLILHIYDPLNDFPIPLWVCNTWSWNWWWWKTCFQFWTLWYWSLFFSCLSIIMIIYISNYSGVSHNNHKVSLNSCDNMIFTKRKCFAYYMVLYLLKHGVLYMLTFYCLHWYWVTWYFSLVSYQ